MVWPLLSLEYHPDLFPPPQRGRAEVGDQERAMKTIVKIVAVLLLASVVGCVFVVPDHHYAPYHGHHGHYDRW